MKVRVARLLFVTAVVAPVFAACGSSDGAPSGGEPPDDVPLDTVEGESLRAPTPIKASGIGSPAAGASSARQATGASELGTDAAISSEMMIAPAAVVTEFVAGPDLPGLPGNETGYVFDSGAMPTADDAALVAAALGVDGEPALVDDGSSIRYQVGPDDGSAPSVTVWDDAMLSWTYQRAWADDPAFTCASSTDVAVIEPVEVDEDGAVSSGEAEPVEVEPLPRPDDAVECVEPEPPTGVPTADEAEAITVELLAALGLDPATLTLETWTDEWSASVTANETFGAAVVRSWGFFFGGDAELQHAWGSVATPGPVGPYDLIGLDAAIERLNDGRYGFGFPSRPGIAVLETAEAPIEDPAVSAAVDEFPEPEEVTVTLTGVGADLWWVWDVDGTAWLVPAYAFTGDDGGVYTVPAVTDEFLLVVDARVEPSVEPTPEPIPVEPDGGIGDGAEPLPADPATLAEMLGAALDDFTRFAESLGFEVRVVEIDGEGLAVTEDFRPNRINVAIVGDAGVEYVVRATMDDGTLVGETTE